MWLGLFGFIILVVGIVASLLSGGIFTIVLIPIGIVVAIVALVTGGLGRQAQEGVSQQRSRHTEPPLPHTPPPDSSNNQPATPDQLLDARRAAS